MKKKFIIIAAILILAGAGYWGYQVFNNKKEPTRYVLAAVARGTLVTSISGTGQVAVSNQVDLKAKASGAILKLDLRVGQELKAGSLVAQIDNQDAQKSVRDALANLDAAKLSLDKLKQPADQLSVMQAENSLTQAQESRQNAQDDLKKAYDDGFNTIANAFLDLPTVMSGLQDALFSNSSGLGNSGQRNIDYLADSVKSYDEKALLYRDDANNKYQEARASYDKSFQDYKSASRFSNNADVETLVGETYDTTKLIAEAVKNANSLFQFYKDKTIERDLKVATAVDTYLSSLNSYTGKTNSHLLNLLSIKDTIKNDRETIVSSERTIAEKTISLDKLKAGADPLDLQSQMLTIKQRENSWLDAKEKLKDYYIYAPFDGVVAAVTAAEGDNISSGAAMATLVTKQKIAEVSLNEVDIAKIKLGQKVSLTFDAIDGLSLVGEVGEIASLGTVSQGVVSYSVKIVFDTQDERVKSGMSVSAAIITQAKQDVLMASSASIKTTGNRSYVEILDNSAYSSSAGDSNLTISSLIAPRQQSVEIGLANDVATEIVSGLNEGDLIITQTLTSSNSPTTPTQQNNALRIPGIGGGGFGGR